MIARIGQLLLVIFTFLTPYLGSLIAYAVIVGLIRFFTLAGVGVATFTGSFFSLSFFENLIVESLSALDGIEGQIASVVLHTLDLLQLDLALSLLLTAFSIAITMKLTSVLFTKKPNSPWNPPGNSQPM
jgi:hypothetical protein